jgi:hypothetical protein
MIITALEAKFALPPGGPYCPKKAKLLLWLLSNYSIFVNHAGEDVRLFDAIVNTKGDMALYFTLRFEGAQGLYRGLVELINDPTKWHVVQAVIWELGEMEHGLYQWLHEAEHEEDVDTDIDTMIVWAMDYKAEVNFFLDAPPRLAKERQAKERWVKLFACVKFLAVHKRATVSANMPSRKRDRGEFEV